MFLGVLFGDQRVWNSTALYVVGIKFGKKKCLFRMPLSIKHCEEGEGEKERRGEGGKGRSRNR